MCEYVWVLVCAHLHAAGKNPEHGHLEVNFGCGFGSARFPGSCSGLAARVTKGDVTAFQATTWCRWAGRWGLAGAHCSRYPDSGADSLGPDSGNPWAGQ